MKKFLKWALLVVVVVATCGFLAFLYFIPPFFLTPPETFGKAMADAAPTVADIADPAERAIAERGRYIVMTTGCNGCHAIVGPQGPDLSKYLGGGGLKVQTAHATYVSRNLTPDKETGLARRTDDEVKRIMRSGTFIDGHVVAGTAMPWPVFSNWTEEDRHAVVVYLRHLKPLRHATPEPVPGNAITIPGAIEQDYGGKDYGSSK
ncbi:MAG TPA: c-type cytochrome [Vicinamibacterales bacterium]|nr:c-type cytochrome [Vicinamibacterales bacterium]